MSSERDDELWCSVCKATEETPDIHDYHNAMLLDGGHFMPQRVCLGCALSNPESVSGDTCTACHEVVARLSQDTGRP